MKRVLMFSSCPMFGRGIERLLSSVAGLEIIGWETEPDRAVERIHQLQPDAVVVDSASQSLDTALLVMRFLQEGVGTKVVGLNLENNTMSVYRGQQKVGLEVEDLVQVIEKEDIWQQPINFEGWAAVAVSRSSLYGFLVTLFRRLGDEEFANSFDGVKLHTALASLADIEGMTEDVGEGFKLMASYSRQSLRKPVDELRAELTAESARLLQGAGPNSCLPLPRESNYSNLDETAQTENLAQLLKAYAGAGAGLSAGMKHPPDAIHVELDFMRHLTEKEAQAWSDCRQAEALLVLEKERAFLDDHLAQWVPRLCDAMLQQAHLDLFRGIARMTKGFVVEDTQQIAKVLPQVRAGVRQFQNSPGDSPAKERSGP